MSGLTARLKPCATQNHPETHLIRGSLTHGVRLCAVLLEINTAPDLAPQPDSRAVKSRSEALHSFRPSASSQRSLSSEFVRTRSTARMASPASSGIAAGLDCAWAALVHIAISRGSTPVGAPFRAAITSAAATATLLAGASR